MGLALALALASCGKSEPPPAAKVEVPGAAQLAELDRGVGLMGRFEFAPAREVFAALAARYPGWPEARLDLAIATMNRQQEGDERAALELLKALARDRPDDMRAAYVLGLLTLHAGAPKEAEPLLRSVVEADPDDAYARYFLAQALLAQGRAEDALPLYESAAMRDARLRSALYGASQALARMGRAREAAERLDAFERLRNNPLARLAEFKYTRMGPRAEAVGSPSRPTAAAKPAGELFAPAEDLVAPSSGFRSRPVASAVDLEGDGRATLYLPRGLGSAGAEPLAGFPAIEFAAWGDIDNDGLVDALLCGAQAAPVLVVQQPRGVWKARDVPALKALGAARDCMLFDADHDGDLDIFVVTQKGDRVLLSNNGDGTFRSLADRLPKPAKASGALQVLAADLDDDRDLDLVVLHAGGGHEVLANERLWSWKAARGFEAFTREPALAVVDARLDDDGETRLLTLTPDLALRSWKRARDGNWSAATLVPASGALADHARAQLAVADVDGDGRMEIAATTPHGMAIWSVAANGAQKVFSIDDDSIVSWTLAALDAKGPSLITYHKDGAVRVRRPGPGRFPFAWIALSGGDATAATSRSNASGIGARLTARVGGRAVIDDTLRRFSGPGQSLVPLALGLGGAAKIDYLAIDWPDGVFQTELALEPGKLHRLLETQRQLSSCPLIFAWDGGRFAFVSDFLGVGGLGYLVAPGEYASPRPWENFLFPQGALREKDGRFAIKIGEPMEEAAYIDSVRLVAHDLPAGWNMALDERMQIGLPRVTGKAFYFRREALPVRVSNDRGEDVTAELREVDKRAADPGPHDRRFIGRLARDHVLTLDFDSSLDAAPGQALLVADGWIEYPYSQTMFAAWQAKADYRAPTLEAKGADGRWRVVLKEFGYPAGMPRRIAVPLPALPQGTRALRLTTNQEIYWDRLAVAWAESAPIAIHAAPLAIAEVRRAGFPRRTTGPQQQPDYDYAHRDPLWDTRTQPGFYTAIGPAAALVREQDDALAIIGPGDELHLEFGALPAPAPGHTRRFVLETHGWAKDMDLYTRDGESVGPLPVTGRDRVVRDRLHREFNTRYASGR